MYSPSNTETFREIFDHTIFTSVVALLKKKKEIKDNKRNNETDKNKLQTNIEENDSNQEKNEPI